MSVTIYHNPRCSKSRQTLELIASKGLKPRIIEYLKTPPTAQDLDEILKKLGLEPEQIVRTHEDVYETLGLKGKKLSRTEWINVLVKNPVLMERPIVVNEGRAVLGRPPENVLKII